MHIINKKKKKFKLNRKYHIVVDHYFVIQNSHRVLYTGR